MPSKKRTKKKKHRERARFSEVPQHLQKSIVLIGILRILGKLDLLLIVTAKLLQKTMI